MIAIRHQATVRAGPYGGQTGTVLEIDRLNAVAWLLLSDRSVEMFGLFEIGGERGKKKDRVRLLPG